MHNWYLHQKPSREKGPHLKSWTCLIFQSWHHVHACRVPYSHLSNVEKASCCRSCPAKCIAEKGGASHGGQQFNTATSTSETWKGPTVPLYLNELLSVNSESIGGSVLSHRVPSRGSCHLVDSTWVTHLNWNNFSNSDEMHRSRKWHQTKKPDTSRIQWKRRISSWCSVLMRWKHMSPLGIRYHFSRVNTTKLQIPEWAGSILSSDWV